MYPTNALVGPINSFLERGSCRRRCNDSSTTGSKFSVAAKTGTGVEEIHAFLLRLLDVHDCSLGIRTRVASCSNDDRACACRRYREVLCSECTRTACKHKLCEVRLQQW